MARWSRSRLRISGVGLTVVLGATLAGAVPVPSLAAPAAAPSAAAPAPDRVTALGRGFRFSAGSGDARTPYAFTSTGRTIQARALGAGPRPLARAASGRPAGKATPVSPSAAEYRVTLTIDSANPSAQFPLFGLWNRQTWTYVPFENSPSSSSTAVDLPPGDYLATALYGVANVDSYLLTKPFTVTGSAQTVVLAESSAREVALRTDDSTARSEGSAVWLALPQGDLVGFAGGYEQARTYATTASIPGPELFAHEVLARGGSSAANPTPYRYDLVKHWAHPFPATFVETLPTASLARTTTTVRGPGVTSPGTFGTTPGVGPYLETSLPMPATFTEYVSPGVTIARLVQYGPSQYLFPPDRMLAAGPAPAETIGAGPLMPAAGATVGSSRRTGNTLTIREAGVLSTSGGATGTDTSAASSLTLSSGGEVLETSSTDSLQVDVPAGPQTYELRQEWSRQVPWSRLNTHVTSEWTFRSEAPGTGFLPLMDVTAEATGLDSRNRAGSAPVVLTVTPSTRAPRATSAIDRVEWSADDGATWTPMSATGIPVPSTAAFVSLRITASNDLGGKLVRTVRHAFAGPAEPGDEATGGATISGLTINDGQPVNAGVGGSLYFIARFTATHPSGLAKGGLRLWHGDYLQPGGVLVTPVSCSGTSCSAEIFAPDVRKVLADSGLAGTWQAEVSVMTADGKGHAVRHNAGSVALKRTTWLTIDATPEPARLGSTITVTGTLIRADWTTGTYLPYAGQTVTMQRARSGVTTWSPVQSGRTDAGGVARTTAAAGYDANYRMVYPGDTVTAAVNSAADFVDVQ